MFLSLTQLQYCYQTLISRGKRCLLCQNKCILELHLHTHKAMVASGQQRFLIDGFPRNEDNLEGWKDAMSDKTQLLFVLFFDCPREECTARCLGRGAAGSGRSDDNQQSLLKRFDTYVNDTMPIIRHYEKLNMVKKIDASLKPDEVFEQVKLAFKEAGITKEC